MGSKAKTDGVGIFVSEKWVDSVASVERHSERVLVLNMVIGDCLPKCFHGVCSSLRETWSCVCAVAQHAVLEANAKVNGRGPFLHPTPAKPLNRFRCHVKYITTSPQGVDVQNLVGIDEAVTDLRMREKTRFVWIFLLTYLSIYLSVYPFLLCGYRSQFWGDFYA